jgi:predicted acyltransferase
MIKQVSNVATLTAPPQKRVLSIDVLRGLTIALMILVNDPGDWDHVYTQLDHAPWNGFTLADLIFPNFLFIVGASIILSLRSRIARARLACANGTLDTATKRSLALHIFKRAAIIFLIGLLFNIYPYFDYHHIRVFGVLQRIALCYLTAGILCLITQRTRTLLAIVAALLIGYWAFMRFLPVPGLGVPTHGFPILDHDRNLAAWFDRVFIAFTQRSLQTGTLYNHTNDPEGLLSTLPAIATTLIGSMAALWIIGPQAFLSRRHSAPELVEGEEHPDFARTTTKSSRGPMGLALAGLISLLTGLLWSLIFPMNKNLWTSSYVLVSAGFSLLAFALCYWLIDIRRINESPVGKWLTYPWLIFGSNAIAIYIISGLIVGTMLWIKIPAHLARTRQPISAWLWVYLNLFSRHGSTNLTSVAFAIAFVAVCFIPNWLLWRKRIFIKI